MLRALSATVWYMVEIVSSWNCLFQTAYHLVFCVQYRHAVLPEPVAESAAGMLDDICGARRWPVISQEVQPDHMHLFLNLPPSTAVAKALKTSKRTAARQLFARFPVLRKRFRDGNLWSPSYYLGTAGRAYPVNAPQKTRKKLVNKAKY